MEIPLKINPLPNTPIDESFLNILSLEGSDIILGEQTSESLVIPLEPSPTTMFGPRGACLVSETGPLWVCDTGHHRLLGWKHRPERDGQPADWIIGQPNFYQEGQNAKGTPQANTLSVPTGICACGEGLAVGDAWNHRVLIWQKLPQDNNTPADIVLGQADFHHNQVNRGETDTAAERMHWPYGVMYYQGKLFVADTGNRRVLVWNQLPTCNGQPADYVLGQPDMNRRDENGGDSPSAASMRWPHGLAIWQNNLVVADAGNNRLMIWDGIPTKNNTPCQFVLGQENFEGAELNRGGYFPTSNALSMPYGVAVTNQWLIAADTANSRLVGWKNNLSMGATAEGLTGQSHFRSKSENRSYGSCDRNSLSWPYGISSCDNTVIVADSGNNRVLLWLGK
ncbi:MAG: NHL repeat-containing protein [Cyanobacteria bacterium P01_G01_bin.49]